ncbi:ATP-dependent Clp protease ATP-binding subunit [Ulvibacter litoralis]|uniref:ATP-dependent Clp protease ATP-binding subunit ClpA n=1 Tax=Ulvibacter litoralis TaxID=227084 RepID=A0A1G7HDY6_9FLAO|nr:ATP-dependent Clp protease ATP-binding subunit [Ulvibacter litoralis]GHC57441.1 ATPase AAA [Ulvibacter litoralis]SDE98581.1 ATP-dependent Clp protease ATP-binding subunit ClpA [Ulvibacter litoralis]
MIDYTLTDTLKQAVHIAQAIAREYAHEQYSAAHLLKALLHKEIGMLKFIESMGQDAYYVEEWAEVRLETLPKTTKVPENPVGDSSVEAVFYEADNIKLKLGIDEVSVHCLLIALCTPGVGFSYDQLKTFPLTPNEIIDFVGTGDSAAASVGGGAKGSGKAKNNTASGGSTLLKYCVDKTLEAKNATIENISGRDSEIKMITEILGRRSKPNVLILGDPGVGKSVMMNGLSYATINENIPSHLKDARVFELDFISLVSGAGYKGEIEDRFQKVFNEIKQFDKPILLIDELKNLTDKTSGNQGLVNILKSELVKGELTVIATATNDAFRKHIEVDEGLARQFETVRLLEPSEDEAHRMIKNAISYYSEHHNLEIDSETISEAIRLAKRYNKERSLPDSAIDLIDRTMSAAKFMVETSVPEIALLKERLDALEEEKLEIHEILAEQDWMYRQMQDKLSYLLFTELGEEDHFENITTPEEGFTALNSVLNNLKTIAEKEKKSITKHDIASTIANKTGIPTGKLQADEKERLLNMEEQLIKRVIGQDHAAKTVTEAVLESRSGLSKPGLPIGSFFFSGPTGTGKTELAKALAEFLFQDETSIIRFDMSEFKEEHSAALLYGAPPGYVGYEEGGLLVNKIRQKPYSIVLFDEIEKAHPSVFDIFLQILDEGKLHDRLGKEGDFSNAVILFTSNIGSQHIVDSFGKGIIPKSSDLLEMMGNHFRPEFLGRLTEIIPFSPIIEANIGKIFKIQLKDLYKALEKQEIALEISDEATAMLAKKGFTPKYGARPLRGVIRSDLRSPLSKMIISGKITKGTNIKLELDEKNELKWNIT